MDRMLAEGRRALVTDMAQVQLWKVLVAGMNMECWQRGETEQWLGIGGVMNVVAREQLGTRRNKS